MSDANLYTSIHNFKKREEGYYFVNKDGKSFIAKFDGDEWWQCTSFTSPVIGDSFWTAIDERKIERRPIKGENKYWWDVPQSHAGWKP